VTVKPATVRYVMKPDRWGRLQKCAVETPAVTKTVARRVLVQPSHTVAHTTPAQYKTVTVPMTIAPARTSYQYTPPKVDYVAHPITLQGPTVRAVHVPAQVVPTARRLFH
jgi:hypothetical protein